MYFNCSSVALSAHWGERRNTHLINKKVLVPLMNLGYLRLHAKIPPIAAFFALYLPAVPNATP